MNIFELDRKGLLALDPAKVTELLTPSEFVYIAGKLGAFWSYDHEAARAGRAGLHPVLKSGLHSDGFFVSRVLLEPPNILKIMAYQMFLRLHQAGVFLTKISWVVGVPDGATSLGREIAKLIGAEVARMDKINGRIMLGTEVGFGNLLIVEDVFTRGTGFCEAVTEIRAKAPQLSIIPFDPVLLNRGGMKGFGEFTVVPIAEHRINDWQPEDCPLCRKYFSGTIRPKVSDENWNALRVSQLPR
ncbi:MAG: hypothetical protein WCT02_04470 [Candidatus Paceibacterota bacterium]